MMNRLYATCMASMITTVLLACPGSVLANSMLELEFLFSIDVEGRKDDAFNEEEIATTSLEITSPNHILAEGYFGELLEFDSQGSLVAQREAASLGLERIQGFTTSLPNRIVIGGHTIGDPIFRFLIYDEDFNFISSITPLNRFGELFSFPR